MSFKVVGEVPKTAHLTWTNVGIGLLFLLLDAALSIFLELGLSASLITAAIRCIVQLSVMVSALEHTGRVGELTEPTRRVH